MKRRTHLIAYIILITISFIVTIAALFFLPNTIPAHYGINGSIDRYGSKFELLIFPIESVVIGAIIWFSSKFAAKKEEFSKNNEKIVLIIGECTLSMFLALQIYFIWLSFANVQNLYTFKVNIGSLMLFIMGIFMVVTGNIMPKAKKNSIVGFRMSWTMKSEEIWKRCQRFAGFAAVIAGFMLIVCGFIFRDITAIIVLFLIIALMTAVDMVYAYRVSHNGINNDR